MAKIDYVLFRKNLRSAIQNVKLYSMKNVFNNTNVEAGNLKTLLLPSNFVMTST